MKLCHAYDDAGQIKHEEYFEVFLNHLTGFLQRHRPVGVNFSTSTTLNEVEEMEEGDVSTPPQKISSENAEYLNNASEKRHEDCTQNVKK